MKSRCILSVLFSTVLLLNGIPKPVSADEPASVTNMESVVVPYEETFADQQPEASASEEMAEEPLTEKTEFVIAEEPATELAEKNDEDTPAPVAEQPADENADPASESTDDILESSADNPADEADPTIEPVEEPTVDSPEETEESVTEEESAEEQLEEVQLHSNHQFSNAFSDEVTSCTYNIVVRTTGDYVFTSDSFPIRVTLVNAATGGSEQLNSVLKDGSYQPINETVRLHKGKYLLQVQSILNQSGRFTLSVAYFAAEKTDEDDSQPTEEKPAEKSGGSSEYTEVLTDNTAASREDEQTGSQADLARLVLQKLSAGQQNDQKEKQKDHEQVSQKDQLDSVQSVSSQASESIGLRETILKLLQKRNKDAQQETEQTSVQADESDSAAGNDDQVDQASTEPAEPDPVALTVEPADTTEQPAENADENRMPDSAQSSPEPEQVEEEETSASEPEAEEQPSQDQPDTSHPEISIEETREESAEETTDVPTDDPLPAPADPVITISFQIEENDDGETVVVLIADVEGTEGPYALQWQYSPDDGATIIDVENATGSEYRYIPDEENALYSWRVMITVIE